MNAQTNFPTIGTPVYRSSVYGDKAGWIAEISEISGSVYTLGAGGMHKQSFDVRVVFDDCTDNSVPESLALDWIKAAQRHSLQPLSPEAVAVKLSESKAASIARQKAAETERQAQAAAVTAFRDKYRDKIPADAQAVIVAELEHDESDSMTDYFNTRTSRCVILAFSTHKRDLFSEMRKAAANFAETVHLVDAPESAEHREKYTMGAGYYLKATGRYSTGWKVQKRTLWLPQGRNDRAESLPFGKWAVPEAAPAASEPAKRAPRASATDGQPAAPEPGAALIVNGFTISEHIHTKRGFGMSIVETPDRVTPDQYTARLNRAKDLGGWYSRAWGKTPAGFAFKDAAKAAKFAESL